MNIKLGQVQWFPPEDILPTPDTEGCTNNLLLALEHREVIVGYRLHDVWRETDGEPVQGTVVRWAFLPNYPH